MGWYLDGRVTAVLGTHTHVPTADERILPGGTAFQTDVGMSGPYDSIIGVEKDLVLHKFLTGMPGKFEAAKGNPKMCAALVTCDPDDRPRLGHPAHHARRIAIAWSSSLDKCCAVQPHETALCTRGKSHRKKGSPPKRTALDNPRSMMLRRPAIAESEHRHDRRVVTCRRGARVKALAPGDAPAPAFFACCMNPSRQHDLRRRGRGSGCSSHACRCRRCRPVPTSRLQSERGTGCRSVLAGERLLQVDDESPRCGCPWRPASRPR